jgi:alpha-beta hydrolase superfamily lysophospholipase
MHGTADTLCSIDATRAYAAAEGARCTLIEWEGYLHELHNGGPNTTGEAVMERIAEIVLSFGAPAVHTQLAEDASDDGKPGLT